MIPYGKQCIDENDINALGEKGKALGLGFEYNSGTNTEWLTNEQFLEMAKEFL